MPQQVNLDITRKLLVSILLMCNYSVKALEKMEIQLFLLLLN